VELWEFIMLWQLLREVSLSAEEEDQNLWKWMSNGEYTASSAYSVQFQGSHPPFRSKKLWKVRTEPKVKIFAWTMMHQKILTADNLEIRGMQHDPLCLLCNSEPEDAKHLFIKCIFTKEVYRLIWLWFRIKGNATPCLPCQELAEWFEQNVVWASVGDGRKVARILLYSSWNVWKEHNKCILDSMHNSELQVAFTTKDEIDPFSPG
jgi:hypothetical protein